MNSRINVPIRLNLPERLPLWPRLCSSGGGGGKYSFLSVQILYPSKPILPCETYLEKHPCPDDIFRMKKLLLCKNTNRQKLLVGAIVQPYLSPSMFPMTFDGIPSIGVIATLEYIDESSYIVQGLQKFEVVSARPHQHVFVRILDFDLYQRDFFKKVSLLPDDALTVHERLTLLLSTNNESLDQWISERQHQHSKN